MKQDIIAYERNIKIYAYYKFFINMLIIGPILTPYMLHKGLNYSQILLLQSVSSIAVMLFEVPTGAIADKISRKFSLFFSGIFMGIGTLLYILGNNFLIFALAETLFGIGMTFNSGADSAMLYESLKIVGRDNEAHTIDGHAESLLFIGLAAGSILSSFLYTINPDLPWWVSLCNLMIGVFISTRFTEPPMEKSTHSYAIHVIKSAGITFRNPRIFWTICFAAFMGFAYKSGFWMFQPYFKKVNVDVIWYGTIFFGFNMIAAFSSKFLVKRYQDSRPRSVLLTLTAIMSLSYILPIIFIGKIGILFIALQQITRGMYSPILKFYINLEIEDKYRATVISMVSLVTSLSFAIFGPFIGISLDKLGTVETYIWVAVVTTAGCIGLYTLRKAQRARKIKNEA